MTITPLAPTEAFELPEDFQPGKDTPPVITSSADTDKSPARCQFDGCTNAVTKPAKGPSPKYCDEHRGTRKSSGTSSNRSSGPRWARAEQVELALVRYVQLIGGGVTFIHADDGEAITLYGPAVAHELVELARTDTKLRKYLEYVATPGKYGPLALAIAGMVLPMLANHGLIPSFLIGVSGKNSDS